jgi:hypothetical protein
MSKNGKIEEQFFALCEVIFEDLRAFKPIKQDQLETLYDQLDQIAQEYQDSDTVPKSIAGVLFDMSTTVYSAISAYPAHSRPALEQQFDQFCDRARDILN